MNTTSLVQGHCDPRFHAVREEFERNFAERGEVGASVCVSLGGETVIDLWGGRIRQDAPELWDRALGYTTNEGGVWTR